ncbi:hypothetical protein ACFL34_05240 [Candidatus Sumerlaeota bacterium]
MKIDIRKTAAEYYDLWPPPFDDVPFYRERLPSALRAGWYEPRTTNHGPRLP